MNTEKIKKLRQLLIKALGEEKENQTKLEEEEAKKLENAKTGEPITLTGYGVINADGSDNGWRFIYKKDAEEHLKRRNEDNK
jgi:hypothetical protein